jgi:hypothetical protein
LFFKATSGSETEPEKIRFLEKNSGLMFIFQGLKSKCGQATKKNIERESKAYFMSASNIFLLLKVNKNSSCISLIIRYDKVF